MPIVIQASIQGYRRAGMAHSTEAVTHPDGAFSEAQIKQLQADPRIQVTITSENQNATSSSTNPTPGAMEPERLSSLVSHIAGLDKNDQALWKQDNTPKASAFPDGTTKEEREAAWSAYVETLDDSTNSNDSEGE